MGFSVANLGTLVRVFGQDYDLFGESVEEILASYREMENTATVRKPSMKHERCWRNILGNNSLNLLLLNLLMGSLHQRHGDTQRDRFLRR